MIKQKYLHRKARDVKYSKKWNSDKYKRRNNIDIFSDLPKHESIRQNRWTSTGFDKKPLYEFLLSKIGCDWNDVYSELLTKVKSKYRYEIELYLERFTTDIIYDNNIPYSKYGKMFYDKVFVDLNNKLVIKSKEELILDSKKFLRKQKILKIFEIYEKESND